MVEISPVALGRLAASIFQELAPGENDSAVFDAESLDTAMEQAHLHAQSWDGGSASPDWGYILGAHAAYMLIARRRQILPGEDIDIDDESLTERGLYGLTYLEGCALTLATLVAETLLPGRPGLGIWSHPQATQGFRDTLRVLQNDPYNRKAAVGALIEALRPFTLTEVREPAPEHWLTRRINAMPLKQRLTATLGVAPLIGAALGISAYSFLAEDSEPVARQLPLPAGLAEVDPGPVNTNVLSRVFVYPVGSRPDEQHQSVVGLLPEQAFVTGLNQRAQVQIRLQWRDRDAVKPNISLAFGADSGLAITPGTTMLTNGSHPNGTPAQDLGIKLAPVSMDSDGEIVYEFELASSPDPNVFYCGYNLRAIRAYTADGKGTAVTSFPVYVFKPCA
ncbi:hypothetical protein [Nocardia abscessus]|uniref:hypothetical protein n=1 Tax=Nocardia abscessus TaxID=120957 RepID=UPI0024580545|nr:hypothetical protein [Nocardia abscessus]